MSVEATSWVMRSASGRVLGKIVARAHRDGTDGHVLEIDGAPSRRDLRFQYDTREAALDAAQQYVVFINRQEMAARQAGDVAKDLERWAMRQPTGGR